jgi:hypothetical protein
VCLCVFVCVLCIEYFVCYYLQAAGFILKTTGAFIVGAFYLTDVVTATTPTTPTLTLCSPLPSSFSHLCELFFMKAHFPFAQRHSDTENKVSLENLNPKKGLSVCLRLSLHQLTVFNPPPHWMKSLHCTDVDPSLDGFLACNCRYRGQLQLLKNLNCRYRGPLPGAAL